MLASLITVLIVATQSPQAAPPPVPIGAIHVTGQSRYSAAQVVKLSGLATRQQVRTADLDASVARMAATGLFSKIGYRYAPDTTNNGIALTYEIEEPAWSMPVVFDNFVWFTDAELTAAVAEHVPTLDRTLPVTDGSGDFMIRALRTVLEAGGLVREVVLAPHHNLSTRTTRFLFKVVDPTLRVCAVHLDGASPEWRARLSPAVAAQIGRAYSRVSLEGFTNGEVESGYHSRGWLDAQVGTLTADLDGCDGVSVTVPVREGDSYTWAGAIVWTGNTAVSAPDLDRLLQVRNGAVADTTEIGTAIAAIRLAYSRIGHVQAAVSYSVKGDPATKQAHLDMRINEGVQFRMGTFSSTGLSERDAADLAKRWRLKPGDVFDGTYIAEFRKAHLFPLERSRRLRAVGPTLTADPASGVIHVRFEFSAADSVR